MSQSSCNVVNLNAFRNEKRYTVLPVQIHEVQKPCCLAKAARILELEGRIADLEAKLQDGQQ